MNDGMRIFTIGPFIALLLFGSLALQAMVAIFSHRMSHFTALIERAVERLERGRILLPTLWGLAAGIFLAAAFAILINNKPVALLGVVIGMIGLALAGLGVGVGSLFVGRALSQSPETDEVTSLSRGSIAVFLTLWIPFAGWVIGVITACAGLGAILELLTQRARGQD